MRDYISLFSNYKNKVGPKTTIEKIKITLMSIILGLIFGMVIIYAMGHNPIDIFKQLFTRAFQDKLTINSLLIFTAIYTLSGLANAIAFKTGLFNIGVPGQMIAGGATSALIGILFFNGVSSYIAVPILLLIAMLIAGAVGLLVGFLKSTFNVHEVVSTILLNWIIFYLFKYLFRPGQAHVDQAGNSAYIGKNLYFGGTGNNVWVACLLLAVSLCVIIFLVLKFTSFGRKLRMTGLNKDASRYYGVNVKVATISALGLSAVVGGTLGFVYYFSKQHFVEKLGTTLPTEGFDGIAIALLAFNSPLMIPFISLFYAIFRAGADGTTLPTSIQTETIMVIFSIIIFFAAISNLFLRFKPFTFMNILFRTWKNKKLQPLMKEASKHSGIINKQINVLLKVKKDTAQKNDKEIKKINNEIKALKMQKHGVWKECLIKIVNSTSYKYYETIFINYRITKFYVKEITKEKHDNKWNNFLLKEYEKQKYFENQIKESKNKLKKDLKNKILEKENFNNEMKNISNKHLKKKKEFSINIRNKKTKFRDDYKNDLSQKLETFLEMKGSLKKGVSKEQFANHVDKKILKVKEATNDYI